MRYVKITEPCCCMPDTGTLVAGIPANRREWNKYNFYPRYGYVGIEEVVNGISILKIHDGIYVPMSGGFEEISEEEYLQNRYDPSNPNKNILEQIKYSSRSLEQRFSKPTDIGILESKIGLYYPAFQKTKIAMGREVEERIRIMSAMMEQSGLAGLDYQSAVNQLSLQIRKDMIEQGWDLKHDQGVSWFAGLISEAAAQANIGGGIHTSREIFSDLFVDYYKLIEKC